MKIAKVRLRLIFLKFRSAIIWNKCLVSATVAYPWSNWVVEKNSDLSDSQQSSLFVIEVWKDGVIKRQTNATTKHQLLQKFRRKWARGKIVTESWNKNGQNGAKSPGKNSGIMREKRMIFCKNYPQIWKYERKCEWVFFSEHSVHSRPEEFNKR